MTKTPSSQPPSGGPRRGGKADYAAGADLGWSAFGALFSGIVVWSAAGWGLDKLFGTRFLLPIGVLLGAGLGIYIVIAKYGRTTTSEVMVTPPKVRKTGGATAVPKEEQPERPTAHEGTEYQGFSR